MNQGDTFYMMKQEQLTMKILTMKIRESVLKKKIRIGYELKAAA